MKYVLLNDMKIPQVSFDSLHEVREYFAQLSGDKFKVIVAVQEHNTFENAFENTDNVDVRIMYKNRVDDSFLMDYINTIFEVQSYK